MEVALGIILGFFGFCFLMCLIHNLVVKLDDKRIIVVGFVVYLVLVVIAGFVIEKKMIVISCVVVVAYLTFLVIKYGDPDSIFRDMILFAWTAFLGLFFYVAIPLCAVLWLLEKVW